jgi:probable rRNA maturation factor
MKIEMRTPLADFDLSIDMMKQVAKMLQYVAKAEKVSSSYCVTVGFTDDARIRIFNQKFRSIDHATDVLSFPMTAGKSDWKKGKPYDLPGIHHIFLGDILISLERCEKQAKTYGHSFEREICFLALHGFLHLLGYDHIEEAERLEMEAKTEAYLDALGVVR